VPPRLLDGSGFAPRNDLAPLTGEDDRRPRRARSDEPSSTAQPRPAGRVSKARNVQPPWAPVRRHPGPGPHSAGTVVTAIGGRPREAVMKVGVDRRPGARHMPRLVAGSPRRACASRPSSRGGHHTASVPRTALEPVLETGGGSMERRRLPRRTPPSARAAEAASGDPDRAVRARSHPWEQSLRREHPGGTPGGPRSTRRRRCDPAAQALGPEQDWGRTGPRPGTATDSV